MIKRSFVWRNVLDAKWVLTDKKANVRMIAVERNSAQTCTRCIYIYVYRCAFQVIFTRDK